MNNQLRFALVHIRKAIPVLAFFLLFIGLGRSFSIALHEPVIGYANNYDMIRIQACHQIWPVDSTFDSIVNGTPQGPLRKYALGGKIETDCFPSSELIFTWFGIKLGTLFSLISHEDSINIQWIGFSKVLMLTLIACIIQYILFQSGHITGMLSHALIILIVLSDPGITLYLNTFYTEFSAVFFLYAALGFFVVHNISPKHKIIIFILFATSLLGFGLSKPQHTPLAFTIGLTISIYFYYKFSSTQKAILTLLICSIPISLQANGWIIPRNETMSLANKVNFMATQISASKNKGVFIKSLGLPQSCLGLNNKNWYSPEIQSKKICFELNKYSHTKLVLHSFLHNTNGWINLLLNKTPLLKEWVYYLYGHVENKPYGKVDQYYGSINKKIAGLQKNTFLILLIAPIILLLFLCTINTLKNNNNSNNSNLFMLFLTIISWLIYGVAICGDGAVDLSKHAHLTIPTMLATYIILITKIVGRLIAHKKIQQLPTFFCNS